MKSRDLITVRALTAPAVLLSRAAIPSHSTDTDDGDWDGPANEARLPNDAGAATYRKAFAWVDPDKDADTKSAYKFIHHFVDADGAVGAASTKACSAGIAVLNGGRGGADIPDADREGVYRHLARHLRDAGMEPPELNSHRPILRADGDAQVMALRFSAFGIWYEIDSWYEGRFLERVLPGAFTKTIAERGDRVKILFNHGMDFFIGDKILGVPEVLEERSDGAWAEVPLLDTSYNRDLIPGLRAGGYGSSFMFNVTDELWNYDPGLSAHNPEGLPERSILQVRLFECGPVTWPASHAATAGLRSIGMTDWYGEQLRSRDRDRHEALVRSFTDFRDKHGLRTSGGEAARAAMDPVRGEPSGTAPQGAAGSPTDAPDTPVVHHASGLTSAQRAARLRALRYPFLTKEES